MISAHKAELRITERARRYILSVIRSIPDQAEFSNLVPVMSWISERSSDSEYIPGPNMALDHKENVEKFGADVYIVDGHKIPISVGGDRRAEFLNKILDYRKGRLVLISPDDFSGH